MHIPLKLYHNSLLKGRHHRERNKKLFCFMGSFCELSAFNQRFQELMPTYMEDAMLKNNNQLPLLKMKKEPCWIKLKTVVLCHTLKAAVGKNSRSQRVCYNNNVPRNEELSGHYDIRAGERNIEVELGNCYISSFRNSVSCFSLLIVTLLISAMKKCYQSYSLESMAVSSSVIQWRMQV